ncbi:MAG TPA: rod shape-determining protein MreC, partial [Candidatus Caenarcaniphilales bacterium]|nr:rod shape-determining protein MreC [Candidatus Caenarcaniphilales bacterium]
GSGPLLELRRGVGFAVAPIQATLRQGASQVSGVFATIAELERLRRANAELEQRAQVLEAENRLLETIRIENEQLSALLDVRSSLEYQTVAAEVISRHAVPQERVLSLDRGADDGIAVDDPVVASGGALVGRVVEVGPNFSRVMLLNDSRFVVIGLVEGSRATGEVRGQLERPLSMMNIASTEEVTVGETVVTAGIDLGDGIRSPYPKGLLIGAIVDVARTPNEVVQSGLVQPAAPLDRLEYVLVITDYEGGLPMESPGSTSVPAP